MGKERKIVVMGGSFNPPTAAHTKLLVSAVDALGADVGLFVPSSDAYVRRKMKKQGQEDRTLSQDARLRMLMAARRMDPRLDISTVEYGDDGRGHSYDTMKRIREEECPDADLYFLVGADKLHIVPRWHKSGAFFEEFDFAVVARAGEDPSLRILSDPMLYKYQHKIHVIPEPEGIEAISSTAIRELLSKGDPAAQDMLDPGVYEILQEEGWTVMDITSFRGDYDFLSNFHEAPVEFDGIRYLNNEAAFQAQKCLDRKDRQAFASLLPGAAKRKGRSVSLRPDWEQVKVGLMTEIVRAKFAQNPDLAERLVLTGGSRLIEGNTWHDTFWGVDSNTGKGANHLGIILMQVREELKGRQEAQA